MPQRDPLTPPLLLAACVVAAMPAAWLTLGADALLASLFGAVAGFGWPGLALSPRFIAVPAGPWSGSHAPVLWAAVLLAGPLGAAVLGVIAATATRVFRSSTWLRVLALEFAVFGLLRLPAVLVAGVARERDGPVGELYRRLGEPQSGRWALVFLGALILWGTAATASRLAVETGRDWMRVDGRQFRRRLARVTVGYPSVVALATWSVLAPWAAVPVMVGWIALTLAAVHFLTV